mmetsp:Transcript_43301/g.106352  ORF Transcript_43301/g.106352 Transcript_43301/m.106352 type:complete len:82 (-) Transcript_43301:255-500(-)
MSRTVPCKTGAAAAVLFTVGAGFLAGGVLTLNKDRGAAIAMLLLGSLAFIPGAWASFLLVQYWRGVVGYRLEDVPSMEVDW